MTPPSHDGLSRRRLFTLSGGAVLASGLLGVGATAAARTTGESTPVPSTGTHLVTLGTAAGPAIRGPRIGISTAIVVDGHLYLVDCGLGMVRQAAAAGLTMDRLRALFLTHLHSDHTSELPGLLLYNWGPGVNGIVDPVRIVGPGPARLPSGAEVHVPPPEAGTERFVRDLLQAYAYDINIRVYDEGRAPLDDLVRPEDIRLPQEVGADPDRNPCPEMEPFEVYADESVRVLATLVNHPPVFPAFAFRFESAGGSVVVSGDTTEHPNVVRLATGADVLVHEAIDPAFYRAQNLPAAQLEHILESHTDLQAVGRVARDAGVGHLVLSHLGGIQDDADAAPTRAVFGGPVTVAADGQVFAVGA
ncbi:MBL fold metallo-hydrolase [Geodermatophilus sp. CPCC 206100]|uniref:MBL fold metallo-hydrolase n=1 Tax=Geodermatophilus sp. CPCC 206100 TaxID=3020054 RepID=UPI003B00BE79